MRNPILLNSLLSPPGAYLFQAYLRRGLVETGSLFKRGGGGGGLFITSPVKEPEYKVEKLKNKKVGGHAAEDQNQIGTSSW